MLVGKETNVLRVNVISIELLSLVGVGWEIKKSIHLLNQNARVLNHFQLIPSFWVS